MADDGPSYIAELRRLIRGWARTGIPVVDRAGRPDEEARAPLSDLGFLLRVVNGGGNQRLVMFVETLLKTGIVGVDAVARAVREAVEADEPE